MGVEEFLHSELDDRTMDELIHYGIKGMRWGVRRERGPDGTVGGRATGHKPNTRTYATNISQTVEDQLRTNKMRKQGGPAGKKKTVYGSKNAPAKMPLYYRRQYIDNSDFRNKIRSAIMMTGNAATVAGGGPISTAIQLGRTGGLTSRELAQLSDKKLDAYVKRVNMGTKYARIPNPSDNPRLFTEAVMRTRVNLGTVTPQTRRLANRELERRQSTKKKK